MSIHGNRPGRRDKLRGRQDYFQTLTAGDSAPGPPKINPVQVRQNQKSNSAIYPPAAQYLLIVNIFPASVLFVHLRIVPLGWCSG
ncbi:MAG: hypothetical protein M3Y12_10345, partial [Bacteroidota bacterium]|nr:hypothetical protein [Bacteroidota bacterium]